MGGACTGSGNVRWEVCPHLVAGTTITHSYSLLGGNHPDKLTTSIFFNNILFFILGKCTHNKPPSQVCQPRRLLKSARPLDPPATSIAKQRQIDQKRGVNPILTHLCFIFSTPSPPVNPYSNQSAWSLLLTVRNAPPILDCNAKIYG